MTLRELAEKRVMCYRRSTWAPGEFVHIEGFLEDTETHTIAGYRACFCSAPIPGNHPECEDDLWLEYVGPETARLVPAPSISAALFNSDLPVEVLAVIGLLAQLGQDQKQPMPDVPPFQISGEMRA